MQVLDQLLYELPVASAVLLAISLISRRSRVVSGLTRWLAIRLMFVWVLVLLVRLTVAVI